MKQKMNPMLKKRLHVNLNVWCDYCTVPPLLCRSLLKPYNPVNSVQSPVWKKARKPCATVENAQMDARARAFCCFTTNNSNYMLLKYPYVPFGTSKVLLLRHCIFFYN